MFIGLSKEKGLDLGSVRLDEAKINVSSIRSLKQYLDVINTLYSRASVSFRSTLRHKV